MTYEQNRAGRTDHYGDGAPPRYRRGAGAAAGQKLEGDRLPRRPCGAGGESSRLRRPGDLRGNRLACQRSAVYRTQTFAGDLLDETEEGRVFWTDPASLHTLPLAENFERYWPLFFSPGELFAQWGEGEPDDFQVYPDKEAAVC